MRKLSKRSPRVCAQSNYGLFSRKRSQAELITTVLIVLISIAAIVLLSAFVMNLVKKNLKNTDCFQTAGQLEVNPDYSYFNSSSKMLYVSVKRAEKDFNLTGFGIVYGNEKTSKKITLIAGNPYDNAYNLLMNGSLDTSNRAIAVPSQGMSKAYAIDVSASEISSVNQVSIAPIISGGVECETAAEESISSES